MNARTRTTGSNPLPLRATILDAALRPDDAMWGDAAAGWQPPATSWAMTLAAAGVPFEVAAGDGGTGLLIVPDPDSHAVAVDRALDRRRPLLLGAPPETPAARLAAVRDALGALVRPDLGGVLVLRLADPRAP